MKRGSSDFMIEMYKKSGEIVSKIRSMAVDYVKADMKILRSCGIC